MGSPAEPALHLGQLQGCVCLSPGMSASQPLSEGAIRPP